MDMVHISETFAVAQPGVLGAQRWEPNSVSLTIVSEGLAAAIHSNCVRYVRTYKDIGEHLNWKKLEGWKTGIAGIALQRWAGNTCTTEACRVPTTQPWDRAWKCTGNHMDVRLTPEVA